MANVWYYMITNTFKIHDKPVGSNVTHYKKSIDIISVVTILF